MNNIKSLNKWANAHTYFSVDLVRIAVGVFLFIKGITFITNTQYLIKRIPRGSASGLRAKVKD